MKNVTISITESVERLTRVAAAKQGKSLSRFVSDMLTELVSFDTSSKQWIQAFSTRKPYIQVKTNPPKREEIYDRKILR